MAHVRGEDESEEEWVQTEREVNEEGDGERADA
jgi:hypothetical protein